MSNKSIKKNYIFNTCYQILLLITPLITTPYISRVLGADGVGVVSYAESIVSYFVLFASMGIATHGQREISYAQDSIEKRSIIFWNTKIFTCITTGFASTIYIIYALNSENPTIYLILILNLLSVLVDITWFFQGMEEFQKIVIRNVFFKILNILYVFIAVKDADDILKYVFGLAIFTFLSNLSLWAYLPKYIKKIDRKDIQPFKDVKVIVTLFIPTIAVQIYTVLDKTMIGVITQDAFENGYYEQSMKIVRMLLMVVASLGTVMIPRIGYHFQRNEMDQVKKYMYRAYRFVWLLGLPLCFGLIMVADNMVPWFFGEGYEKVIVLLRILAFTILVIGLNNIGGMQYLIPTKREKIHTIIVIAGACTNFILNMILIPRLQSIGAAIASVVAETIILILQLIYVRKELSTKRILKEGKNYYIACAVMVVVLYFEKKILDPTFVGTLILVITGACVYFVSLFILRDEFFVSNVEKVLSKIKSKA